MAECLHEPQLAVERAEILALEIHVEVRIDLDEAMALVPAPRSQVIARPRFEADDLSLARLLIALFLALDGIEEGGVEEREQTTDQPAALISVFIRTYQDLHARSVRTAG